MKKIFRVRNITMIVFLVVLFGFTIVNLKYSLPNIKEIISTEMNNTGEQVANNGEEEYLYKKIERTMEENFIGKEIFVEGYGYIQQLMKKNEFSNFDIVKDENNNLHYSYFDDGENDMDEIINRTATLKEFLDERDIAYLHVVPSSKNSEINKFETGIPMPLDNETVDTFLEGMDKEKIEYLDLRTLMMSNGLPDDEQFFKTDHHWTIQACFWAFTEIVERLNEEYDAGLDPDEYYTNIDNYNKVLYENSFLGSLGRKTGINYGGVDDFTLITPKYETDYTNTTMRIDGSLDNNFGEFEGVIVNMDPFQNVYKLKETNSDKYFTYLSGNWPYVSVTNNNVENDKKLLLIKDSYAVPVASFLTTTFKQVDLVDPRYIQEPIEDIIERNEYDYVVTLFSLPNYTEEFFKFGEER